MNHAVQFSAHGDTEWLLERLNTVAASKDGQERDPATMQLLNERLEAADTELMSALQADRDAAYAAVQLLAGAGSKTALFNLLAHLEIGKDDTGLLAAAIDSGLGGMATGAHQWIVDYDIVGQRIEMIASVILPHVAASCPEKTLFRALKEHEAHSLAANLPLLDPVALHRAIGSARPGFAAAGPAAMAHIARDSVRLVMPNETFNILLRLAWSAQDYLFDLYERYSPAELIAVVKTLSKVVPVYLIPTHLGYPMGGGESFLHQTCRILSEFGVNCVWVSFLDPKSGWYAQSSHTATPYYLDVRVAGGCSKEAIQQAVDQFHPDLIHAQGGTSDVAMEIAAESRLTTLVGYHFWHGLVELGATGNQHILDHAELHRLAPAPLRKSRHVHTYVASEFMQEVYARAGGKEQLAVIHPISDAAQFLAKRDDAGSYVLQVNVCKLKGGAIFRDCVRALGDTVPFLGVQSEPGDDAFFNELSAEVARHPHSRLTSYGNVREFYRNARIVIVPTLVDETFCRVAFEAAMNGIPVLCTANGYLPQMLGETGVFLPEESADWIECIEQLYHDPVRLKQIGEAQRARLTQMFGSDFTGFIRTAMGLIDHAATRNVGIFTVWGDLGLGNLAHIHAKLLRRAGYRVHIFSFQPYGAIGKGLVKQNNPADWSVPLNADSVYYSFNHREEVSVYELSQFILAHDVHTLLVPEICWQPNWDRLFGLRINKLMICSVPMIEIVIEEEIPHHNRLTSTFYSTRLTEQVLDRSGVNNGAFLGFGLGLPLPAARLAQKRHALATRPKIRFVHVAGHNPTTRKNTPQVMAAFVKALAVRDDIELTVTSMDPVASYYRHPLPPEITVIDRSLSRDEILDLYEQHDISIQVSSHEGLGLGFYESTSRGTPVLSLDAAPHNEVVLEGETGWLIPARPMAMPDNNRSVVSAWQFDTTELTNRIAGLNRPEIDRVIDSTVRVFMKHFDEVALLTRFLQVMPRLGRPEPALAEQSETPVQFETAATLPAFAQRHHEPIAPVAPRVATTPRSLAKRLLYTTSRRIYQLAKPLTRRLTQRLSNLMVDAGAGLRQDMKRLSDAQATQTGELFKIASRLHQDMRRLSESQTKIASRLHQDMRRLSESQTEHCRELASVAEELRDEARRQAADQVSQIGELVRQEIADLSQAMGGKALGSDQQQLREVRASLLALSRETRFIKDRMASYAGERAVLTYLKDESPIFVNTGDLGCPSPIVNGGVWEPENLDVLLSLVTDDTVFLDIGANVGYYTIAIGNRLGPRGRVFAVEPHPVLTNLIERSVHLNSLERTVTVCQCAVSDQAGTLQLFYPDDHLGKGSATRNQQDAGTHVTVQSLPLDQLLPADLVVDLVKIDVEGHELNVLRGMRDVLRRSPQVKILFEKLESAANDPIAALFAGLGHVLYGVGPGATLVPLADQGYRDWVGDVLAAPAGALDALTRTGFSLYPGQLHGAGTSMDALTRYQMQQDGIAFFGPDWLLRAGRWELVLHGAVHGAVRLVIVEEHENMLAELQLAEDVLEGSFEVAHDIVHFELRAYAGAGSVIDLKRIDLRRC